MPKFKRVIRDKRRFSRLTALLACEFEFEKVLHRAVILDMSLNGVSLSAKLRLPNESHVTLFLQSPHLSQPLVLEGTVVRSGDSRPEKEGPSAFAVQFDGVPPGILKILKSLISEQEGHVTAS